MNIFQLLIADSSKLTTAQMTLQRALRTFIIAIITGTILEVAILTQASKSLSLYSLAILVLYALFVVLGHTVEPLLIQYGFSKDEADTISTDIETVATMIPHEEQKQNTAPEAPKEIK